MRAFDRASPGAIGGTTPAAITGTTITANTALVTDTVSEKTATAGVTVDGAKFKDGNFVPASGSGVDFAAAGSGDRLLDDFQQEQTYTVGIATSTGTVTVNATNNKLAYRVLGKEVRIQGRIQIDSVTGPPTGNALIDLPISSGGLAGLSGLAIGDIWLYDITGSVIVGHARVRIEESSSYMQIFDELAYGAQNDSVAGLFKAGTYIAVDISYFRS
jgi:hypothetical protein